LQSYALIVSASEALHMSYDEVESKFNVCQLVIMSIIQRETMSTLKNKYSGRRIVNRHGDPETQNKKAWNML
jgi:hypothetical protein